MPRRLRIACGQTKRHAAWRGIAKMMLIFLKVIAV